MSADTAAQSGRRRRCRGDSAGAGPGTEKLQGGTRQPAAPPPSADEILSHRTGAHAWRQKHGAPETASCVLIVRLPFAPSGNLPPSKRRALRRGLRRKVRQQPCREDFVLSSHRRPASWHGRHLHLGSSYARPRRPKTGLVVRIALPSRLNKGDVERSVKNWGSFCAGPKGSGAKRSSQYGAADLDNSILPLQVNSYPVSAS